MLYRDLLTFPQLNPSPQESVGPGASSRTLSNLLVLTVGTRAQEFLPMDPIPRPCMSLLPASILLRSGQGQGCGQSLELYLLQGRMKAEVKMEERVGRGTGLAYPALTQCQRF